MRDFKDLLCDVYDKLELFIKDEFGYMEIKGKTEELLQELANEIATDSFADECDALWEAEKNRRMIQNEMEMP